MKASNHRSNILSGSSVGLASQESPIPEQIYCPLINGTLPRTSCEIRQRNPESHRECRTDAQGNCRAKRVTPQRPTAEAREKMIRAAAYKTRSAHRRAEEILQRFGNGESVDDIAEAMGCCRDLVYRRLRDAGIYQQPGGPIRKQIFDWLDDNPEAGYLEIRRRFDCAKGTASSYRRQYRSTARYRAALLKQSKK